MKARVEVISRVKLFVAVSLSALSITPKVNVAENSGMPVILPVEEFSVRPEGREPL